MACLRLTLIDPRLGFEDEARTLMKELDAGLASRDGFIMSLLVSDGRNRVGRLSLWESKQFADQSAGDLHVMAVRSRLHNISVPAEESLLEVESGHLPERLDSLLKAARLTHHVADNA
jgi:hypothetical protein